MTDLTSEICQTKDVEFDQFFKQKEQSTIRPTYKKLALICHPDRCGQNSQKCTENFQKLNISYQRANKGDFNVDPSIAIEPQYLEINFKLLHDNKEEVKLIRFMSTDDIRLFIEWRERNQCTGTYRSNFMATFCNSDYTEVTECIDDDILMKLYIFHAQNSTGIDKDRIGIERGILPKFFKAFIDMYNNKIFLEELLKKFIEEVPTQHEEKFGNNIIKKNHLVANTLITVVKERIKTLGGGRCRKPRQRRTTKRSYKKKHAISLARRRIAK